MSVFLLDNAPQYLVGCVTQTRTYLPGLDEDGRPEDGLGSRLKLLLLPLMPPIPPVLFFSLPDLGGATGFLLLELFFDLSLFSVFEESPLRFSLLWLTIGRTWNKIQSRTYYMQIEVLNIFCSIDFFSEKNVLGGKKKKEVVHRACI